MTKILSGYTLCAAGMLWMDWCDQRIWALLYRNVEQKTAGLYVS